MLVPALLLAQNYSLDELIDHGMKSSFNTQKTELTFQSSVSNLNTAKWNLLPEAGVSFNTVKKFYDPTDVYKDNSSLNVSVSKSISLNDPTWYNYRYAKLNQETAVIRRDSNLSSYAYSVFTAYLDVLNAERQLKSLEENYQIQNRIWEQSKALMAQGKTTEFDVKQNEIAVMNSRISILKINNTIETSRKNLFGLVQMEDEGLPLSDLEFSQDYSIPTFDSANIESLQLLKQEITSSEITQKREKLDYFPVATLSYNLARSVGGLDYAFDQYDTSHTLSLSLSYSFWNQFRQSESVKRAKITRQMNQLELMDQEDALKRQYANSREELSYLTQLDLLYAQKLEQAKQQIKIAEERYKLGMIEQLELDKTRSEYISTDIDYNTNRYQIIAKRESINSMLSQKILGKW